MLELELRGSKYKMTYVRPHIFSNKQISPIFNCVTPDSVSLSSLARQLYIYIYIYEILTGFWEKRLTRHLKFLVLHSRLHGPLILPPNLGAVAQAVFALRTTNFSIFANLLLLIFRKKMAGKGVC